MKRLWKMSRPKLIVPKRRLALGYTNAIYGVADYLSLPIGMLIAAPFLLRHLGTSQYGVWILASAAVSSGGIISGSFGDAVIKHVGECRGRKDRSRVLRIVRNMISINLTLSGIMAVVLWFLAPYVTRHLAKMDLNLQATCLQSLRVGSGLLLVKSIESVFISTLRAFETYGATVRIAICSRCAVIASAVTLVSLRHSVVWIMVATLIISTIGMVAQALALQDKVGRFSLIPSWHGKTVSGIAEFGALSWLQAVSGIVFSQADRFLIGFLIGPQAIAYYGLYVQAAQPIHGLISSGMHFLFPHLSARYSVAPTSEIRRKVATALKINFVLVAALSLPVVIFGKHVLTAWIGTTFDQQPSLIFPIIACSFTLLGMNVTAHYALLAAGQVRIVTCLNLLAGIAMLLLMAMLIPKHGLQGASLARLVYGPVTCLTYFQLYKIVWQVKSNSVLPQSTIYKPVTTVE